MPKPHDAAVISFYDSSVLSFMQKTKTKKKKEEEEEKKKEIVVIAF